MSSGSQLTRRWCGVLYCLMVGLLIAGCSQRPGQSFFNEPVIYFQTSADIAIEVYYEPGAEPYAGTLANGHPDWSIFQRNLQEIFSFRSKPAVISMPLELAQMVPMESLAQSSWTADQIFSLFQRYRQKPSTGQEVRFYIYFLNGHLFQNGQVDPKVLGVSFNDLPIIAIFKDVIRSAVLSGSRELIARFIEQTVLIHEMGHALGFVDNGVPMQTPHRDMAHGFHTTNPECVMYWLNEGVSDLRQFVEQFVNQSSVVMWGPEILADARAFSR